MEKIRTGVNTISFELPTPFGLFTVDGVLDGAILRAKVRTPDGRDATLHLVRTEPTQNTADLFGVFALPSGERVITTARKDGQLRMIDTKSLTSVRLVRIGDRFIDASSIAKDPAAMREVAFPPGERLDVLDQEPVTFRSGSSTLGGTFFTPRTKGPHATAVVVHGSGAVTRDMLLLRAQLLLRMGVAVFLYDKRGTGESQGAWREASFEDLAADALAAIAYLRTRDDVDQTRLGIVGHSQAGWIIPIVTSRDPKLAFSIILSGGAVAPEEQEIFRAEAQTKASAAKELATLMWRYARTGSGWESYEKAWQGATKEPWFADIAGPRTASDPLWTQVRLFAAYDPLPYLKILKVPTLVILGANDENHPTKRAAELWRKTNADVLIVKDTGHNLMRKRKDGKYAYAPEYVDAMRRWLEKRRVRTVQVF